MKRIERKDRLCIIATAVFLFIYTVWRLGWTIPSGKGPVPVVCWIVLTVVEFVGLFELAVFIYEFVNKGEISLPSVDDAAFPDVDVFIFTINEPEELLAKTIYACKKMNYPDGGKVHVYLCDDGARETMHELSEKMGIHYLCRNLCTIHRWTPNIPVSSVLHTWSTCSIAITPTIVVGTNNCIFTIVCLAQHDDEVVPVVCT